VATNNETVRAVYELAIEMPVCPLMDIAKFIRNELDCSFREARWHLAQIADKYPMSELGVLVASMDNGGL
jgi:hypothetical protein